jgi:hypothetical protein
MTEPPARRETHPTSAADGAHNDPPGVTRLARLTTRTSPVTAARVAFSWHLSITQCDAVCQQADIRSVADAPGQP